MTIDEHAECPVLADFDPLSPEFLSDPFAVLASLPPEAPVFYAPSIDYYVVTRYADVEALRLVEGRRITFHPNISFRGPQAFWVRPISGEPSPQPSPRGRGGKTSGTPEG